MHIMVLRVPTLLVLLAVLVERTLADSDYNFRYTLIVKDYQNRTAAMVRHTDVHVQINIATPLHRGSPRLSTTRQAVEFSSKSATGTCIIGWRCKVYATPTVPQQHVPVQSAWIHNAEDGGDRN